MILSKGFIIKAETATYDSARAKQFFANKMAFTTGPVELNRRIERGDDIVIVDVREPEDYRKGHIPNAINLPKAEWQSADGLRNDTLNVLYCYTTVCHLVASAAVEFAARGFPVMEMDGGFEAWKENDLPVEKERPRWHEPRAAPRLDKPGQCRRPPS